MQTLNDKIQELNDRLLDIAETNGIHMLVNITTVDGDRYYRTMGASAGFPPDKLMYASLGQASNLFSSISGYE